jgi:hypothetical protein
LYIYIWRDPLGVPFYVGLTKRIGRTNPKNNGGRNWLTQQKLEAIKPENVVVEIQHIASEAEGIETERRLIAKFGRIQLGTGPLTNLRTGGEGIHSPTQEHREKLRAAMLNPSHPCRSESAREKQRERMKDPEVRALFTGDKNPAKRKDVRQKLKLVWANTEYRKKQSVSRIGVPKNFSPEELKRRSDAVRNNPKMKGWSAFNGKDPEFDAKRIAGIRAAQGKRREKMSDPAALAQRKARLKATLSSPEYAAKRAAYDTPEYRAKLSAAKKAYWEKRRAEKAK